MLFANLWTQASKDLQTKEPPSDNKKTTKPRFLAVFDFDYTIADLDTFFTLHEKLHTGKLSLETQETSTATRSYIPYTQKVMEILHKRGITEKEIRQVIENIPCTPGLDDVLRFLKENNCEVIIISDANSLFIDYWLKFNKLQDLVDHIFTNTAYYDNEGCLRIEGYHVQDTCLLSNTNLCKGDVLEKYVLKRADEDVYFSRIAYVGDGSNDVCPCLRLSDMSLVFPRIGFTFFDMLKNNVDGICENMKALVYPWNSGKDILFVLEQLKQEF